MWEGKEGGDNGMPIQLPHSGVKHSKSAECQSKVEAHAAGYLVCQALQEAWFSAAGCSGSM